MGELEADVILSSWPWRLGTVIYEPIIGLDLASFDLQDLKESPDWVPVSKEMLDPRRRSEERGRELLAWLESDQESLQTLFQAVSPDAEEVCLSLSDIPEVELDTWLQKYGLSLEQIEIGNLEELLEELLGWDRERHHEFLSDWWERWEIPHRQGPSAFRQSAGPEGSVFGSYGDEARDVWRRELMGLSLEDFSLWAALRAHWAWRIEFSDEPWPGIPVLAEVDSLFGDQ